MLVISCSSQFAGMSSRRKVQMPMMWKEGHRRRSPRISGLNNACKAQPMRRVKVGGKNAAAAADHHRINGPASRTRARKKRKLRPLQDVATPSSVSPISQQSQDPDANGVESDDEQGHENDPSNTDKPLLQSNDSHQVTYPEQPSSVPSTSWMPEKRVLQHIIDILQRRDTYEIFAEPVDPEEVEDYYEIIKEPMDFGTMRAKLHEGMYTSLEQFEHDVFLISRNAMHFNSSATIYFRQARAIQELAKKVFHALKTDPDNFELEFSETKRRSGRRLQSEASGPIHSSSPKLATNLRLNNTAVKVSSKTTPCSFSGSSNLRRNRGNFGCSSTATLVSARDHEMLSGAKDGRKTSYSEADRRCTYIPWTSFLNENDSMSSAIYNNSRTLMHVNQQDIGYQESLMLFVKDLGPTARMIAKRKLQGWSAEASNFQTWSSHSRLQAPKCQNLPAFTSAQLKPPTLDINFSTSTSRNLFDQFRGLQTITSDTTGTHVASKEVSPNSDEKKKIPSAFRWEDHARNGMNTLSVLGTDKGHKNGNNGIQSIPTARELNFSVAGSKDAGSKSLSIKESLESNLEHCQPDVTKCSSSSAWPLQTSRMSTSHQTRGDDLSIAAAQGSGSLSEASQPLPIVSQFTFDLPYLKTRLDQINASRRDRLVQCSGSGGSILEKMSY
ncbi:hypothetical protein JRO89_XS12G0252100 [Xanthoceras sorbifolium]|uniref:Bromo domain-containing protein n=1 Tax=Xanthoceras sorbifolium TaxID=99658 RepID=A0ABQ8HDU5_9ROSI|nr:hypothetical protein JRO89_XS12G0252100 [Xanthoceras sorbifolium]